MNASDIQKQLNLLPRMSGTLSANGTSGGVVQLPPGTFDLGITPLRIWSTCTLRGVSMNATRLIYRGEGFPIRFATPATNGFCAGAGIEDLAIFSDGDGVGFDASVTSDAYVPRVRNVLIDCAGTAVSMKVPNPNQQATRAILENVIVQGWGFTAIEIEKSFCTSIDGLTVMNNTRKAQAGPLVHWNGSGKMLSAHLEDGNNRPLLYAKNTIELVGQHFETATRGIPQVTLDVCVMTAGRTYYVQDDSWWSLVNGSRLCAVGGVGWTKGTIEQSYRCDATSSVVDRGKLVVGMSN